jgi:hypothetical protein
MILNTHVSLSESRKACTAVLAAAADDMQYRSTVIGHPHGLKRAAAAKVDIAQKVTS